MEVHTEREKESGCPICVCFVSIIMYVHEEEGHAGVEAPEGGERADGPAQALPRLVVCCVLCVWGGGNGGWE